MSPQRRVPSTSHQRSASGSTAGPPPLVGGDQLVVAADPGRPAAANRTARPARTPAQVLDRVAQVGQLPVEHGRQAVGIDMRLPRRKSPWTTAGVGRRRAVGGRASAGPARRPGWGWPSASSRPRSWRTGSSARRWRGHRRAGARGCRPAPRRPGRPARSRAAANSSSRRMRAGDGLPRERPMTRNGRAHHAGVVGGGHHRRHRHAGRGRGRGAGRPRPPW